MKTASRQLPLTPAQEEWMQRSLARKHDHKPAVDRARRCGTCRFMQRHPFTDRINYCKKGTSAHTPNGLAKTRRNDVCQLWEGAKP